MSGKIEKYTMVCDQNTVDFSERINGMIAAGWKLYGTPFSSSGFLCQAMVRETYGGKR